MIAKIGNLEINFPNNRFYEPIVMPDYYSKISLKFPDELALTKEEIDNAKIEIDRIRKEMERK